MKRTLLTILAGFFLIVLIGLGYWSWSTNRQVDASENREVTAGAPGRFVTVDGYQLHVQTLGDPAAPPLLLVHGFGIVAGQYFDTLGEELARDFYVIVPDLLGFGHSQRVTEPVAAYSHAGQAALLDSLLTELGVEQTPVVGHSYGGGVAVQLALDHPQRVERLVLIAPQVYTVGGGIFETLVTLPFGLGRALTWTSQGAGPRAEMLATFECDSGYCPTGEELQLRQQLAEIENTTDALLAFTATPDDARFPGELPQVDRPVLILWGTADTTVPYADNADRLAADLPNGELISLEGLGHSPFKQVPVVIADLIREWLLTANS